ncbi:hypothetical protein Q644_16705 [Brucella intermedia 229E]|uniref:Class II aldolase/adducin N-terminal domain-containing protein n=1 Tax=Brucella intermedia 229E TaxID=1337887 RepID=U4V8V7_9HYPH|nr:hypothetical protein Q644_16705 [Brucella intermedia 229E]
MKSNWSQADFDRIVGVYERAGVNRDVAIRTYTTRLLGSEPKLVLHGGGNTSVKTTLIDHDGSEVSVLCVKGSGWDMGRIEPAGLPALHLEPLKAMVNYETLSDDDMVMLQRRLLLDPAAPNPSVEAILHAILPFKHVDHTHANAIVALTNQPRGRRDHSGTIPGDDYRALCHAGLRSFEGVSEGIFRKARCTRHDLAEARYFHLVGGPA